MPTLRVDTMTAKNILIIEDNEELAQLLALHLRDLHHRVELCFDGASGLLQATTNHYDMIVLDLMLPGNDGLSVCKAVRASERYTPILMLTAKSSEFDRVLGLESGADDYVTKPFSISEVLARIKAIFRRVDAIAPKPQASAPIIRRGPLRIDQGRHAVSIDGRTVDLTAKEFDLLLFFARQPGRVFTRNELLDQVWGYGHDGYEHTVNSHINRLRVKIENDPKHPTFIQTVWGVGYKFAEE